MYKREDMSDRGARNSWKRLIQLIKQLEEGPQSAAELAELCECAPSTMRRDLLWLEEHYPVVTSKRDEEDGRKKLYLIDSPSKSLMYPGAFYLLMGVQAASSLTGSASWDGMEKMISSAQGALRDDIQRKIISISSDFNLDADQLGHFDILVEALQHEFIVEMTYRSVQSGEEKSFDIEPWSLMNWRGRLYLMAKKSEREGALKIYRLDRIVNLKHLSPRRAFRYPLISKYDPRSDFKYSFGPFFRPEQSPELVVLRFYDGEVARHRRFSWPVPHQVLNEDPLEIELEAHIDPTLVRFILRLGDGVEVLSPASFRETIQERILRASGRYAE